MDMHRLSLISRVFFIIVVGAWYLMGARAALGAEAITLTLSQAIDWALTHNISLKADAQDVMAASGERLAAFQAVLPTVTGAANYTRNLKKNVIFFPNTRTGQIEPVSIGQNNSYDFRAQATQPLFDFGGMYYSLKSAGLSYAASQAAFESARSDLVYEATVSYYHIHYLENSQALARRFVEQARAELAAVRAKKAGGLKSTYDVLDAQTTLKTREAAALQSDNELAQEWRRFRTLLDIDSKMPVALADALPMPESVPVDFDALLTKAVAQNPFLRQLHLSAQSLKAAWKGSERQWMPRFDGSVQYDLQGESDKTFPDTHDFVQSANTGVTLSVPFFDGLRREGEIKKAKAAYLKALYNMQSSLRDFVDNASGSYDALRLASAQYAAQSEAATLAQEAYRQAKARRELGLMTTLELETAELRAHGAERDALEAKWNAVTAKAALDRLTGSAPNKKDDSHGR